MSTHDQYFERSDFGKRQKKDDSNEHVINPVLAFE